MSNVTRLRFAKWSELLISGLVVAGLQSFGTVGSAVAEGSLARFPIGTDRIEAAMRDAAIPAARAEVKLSVPMTTATANAALQVESASVLDRKTVRLRLTCRDHSQCLPFFATVLYAQDVDAGKFSASRVSGDVAAKPAVARESTLRVGMQTIMECDAEKIHIRIEVICLEAGAPGSRIRVSSLDHKQIYMARVDSAALLKGELLK